MKWPPRNSYRGVSSLGTRVPRVRVRSGCCEIRNAGSNSEAGGTFRPTAFRPFTSIQVVARVSKLLGTAKSNSG
eukprot:293495-Rhodomonas_salina.1